MDIFPLSIIIEKEKIHQKLHLISEHSVAEVAILLAVFFLLFLVCFFALAFLNLVVMIYVVENSR